MFTEGPRPWRSTAAGQGGATARAVREPAAATAAAVPAPDPREKALARRSRAVRAGAPAPQARSTTAISSEAFKNYIDTLDAGKMFLLASDRDALAKYADKIDDELHAARSISRTKARRRSPRASRSSRRWSTSCSRSRSNLTNEEYVEIDPEKLQLATTDDELKTRWRQRLELEVLERVAGMEAAPQAAEDRRARARPHGRPTTGRRRRRRRDKIDDAARADPDDARGPRGEGARRSREDVRGRFARLKHPGPARCGVRRRSTRSRPTLDPHTTYLPPADKANFDIRMSGSLEGIGAVAPREGPPDRDRRDRPRRRERAPGRPRSPAT